MTNIEKLLILADACSEALYGGERGWERGDFKEFVSEVRRALVERNRLKSAMSKLDDLTNSFDSRERMQEIKRQAG